MITLIEKKEFNKLTAAQKRVAIANDVLERLRLEMLIPNRGSLFSGEVLRKMINRRIGDDAKTLVNSVPCEACAKGALVCSWVGNFNKVSASDMSAYDYDLGKKRYPAPLMKLFGREQLDLIEAYFEGQILSSTCDKVAMAVIGQEANDEENTPFKSTYKGSLKKIMQNIVDNGGTFAP